MLKKPLGGHLDKYCKKNGPSPEQLFTVKMSREFTLVFFEKFNLVLRSSEEGSNL